MPDHNDNAAVRARITADVDAPDKVLYGLTLRQVAILAVAAVAFYGLVQAARHTGPMLVLVAVGVVWGALAFGLAVGRRDGQPLDVWLVHAWRHRRAPKALASQSPAAGSLPDWAPAATGAGAGPALIVLFVAIIMLAFLGCMLMHATLTGIYSAVLYRYAAGGSDAPGFDHAVLASAFQQKS